MQLPSRPPLDPFRSWMVIAAIAFAALFWIWLGESSEDQLKDDLEAAEHNAK
jgi:hypothetical protein